MPADTTFREDSLFSRLVIAPACNTNWLVDGLLLLSRLYAGITIASAGFDKLPTPPWMVEQVGTMGFPFPEFSAIAACLIEFSAGLLLALGLLTRPAALALAIVMGSAAFVFHGLRPILDMHIAQGFVWLFVVFLAVGPGRLSLDGLLRGIFSRRSDQAGHAAHARTTSSTKQLALPAAAGVAALVAAPILGFAIYRELTTTWQPPATENVAEIKSVSVAGTFNDWSLDANPMQRNDAGLWRTTLDLTSSGPIAFKFATNGSWDVVLGTDEGPAQLPVTATGDPRGKNIVVVIPEAGRYVVEVNEESREYTVRTTE